MKLKKKIYKIDTTFFKKFLNCSHRSLGKGDYVRLNLISLNPKKKGLNNLRLSKRSVLLLKKKRTGNTCTLVVSALYKHDRVTWRYMVTSPHMVSILFLRKVFKKNFTV